MSSGLKLLKDVISEQEEIDLLNRINLQSWENTYKRRTQQYGYFYDYLTRKVFKTDKEIQEWMIPKCVSDIMKPEQIIINEYKKGQSIGMHVDALCFGPTIVILSLGAQTTMKLANDHIILPRRSLLILSDKARYISHGLTHTRKDPRISITYRTISKR